VGIEFILRGEREITAKVSGLRDKIAEEMRRALNSVNTDLQRHIQNDKLRGQVLKSHSFNLFRSILQIPAEQTGDTISGRVGLGREARYGLAHEFGAHIPERVPVKAKALHWIGAGGEDVFAMRARAFDLPERSFMRSSFAEFRDRIEDAMREAARKASES
jgi:hypothetical protein